MLSALILVFLISGTLSQKANENNLTENPCVVPPKSFIKHGSYRVIPLYDEPPPAPGEKLLRYTLSVTCDPGYQRMGDEALACWDSKGIRGSAECIPLCKSTSPELLSCGLGFDNYESKCLVVGGGLSSSKKTNVDANLELKCGRPNKLLHSSVASGRAARRDEVPWFAGIYSKNTNPYMQMCGGTLVTSNVVISAAHCFWTDATKKQPAGNYAIAVGKLYRPWNAPKDDLAQKSDVQEILIPPRFQGSATNFQEDIAVVIVSKPFNLDSIIIPACLDFNYQFDTTQLAHGKTGRVAGWGLTGQDAGPSPVLNVVELPVVRIEQCIATTEPGFLPSITGDKICAGYTNGTAVCRGDSGGGLAFPERIGENERYVLRGIVSTAPTNEHACNIYAVPTFTHVIRHENFIQEAISKASSYLTVRQASPDILDKNLGQTTEILDPGFAVTLGPNKQSNTNNDDLSDFGDIPEDKSQNTNENQGDSTKGSSSNNGVTGSQSPQVNDKSMESQQPPFTSQLITPLDSINTNKGTNGEPYSQDKTTPVVFTLLEDSIRNEQNPSGTPLINQPLTEKTPSILEHQWVTTNNPDYEDYQNWKAHQNWHNSHRPDNNQWNQNLNYQNYWQNHHAHHQDCNNHYNHGPEYTHPPQSHQQAHYQNWHNHHNHEPEPVPHGFSGYHYK